MAKESKVKRPLVKEFAPVREQAPRPCQRDCKVLDRIEAAVFIANAGIVASGAFIVANAKVEAEALCAIAQHHGCEGPDKNDCGVADIFGSASTIASIGLNSELEGRTYEGRAQSEAGPIGHYI